MRHARSCGDGTQRHVRLGEGSMPYSLAAMTLRRCTVLKRDGQPCLGWAVWTDPVRRSGAHSGRRR